MNLYFVLSIPAPFAAQVMAIRRSQKENFFAQLPVEITIAGSTGVGLLDQAQNLPDAYKKLDEIAADTAPIEAAFGKVVRYPGSAIYALTIENEEPFRQLHQRIAKSGLKFHESPHAFQPHCTLSNQVPSSKAGERALLDLRVPGRFTLDEISVCRLDRPPVTLLHTAPLARRAA